MLLVACACAHAQGDATGTYAGTITTQVSGNPVPVGLTLVISSVDGERVHGVAKMGGRSCGGDYPFDGYLRGSELAIRSSVKGGRGGDCPFAMRGTLDGNRITGTAGSSPVQLSR